MGGIQLIVVAVFVLAIQREHAVTTAQEGERLQGQAKVIDDNLIRQLEGVNNALIGVRDDFAHTAFETTRKADSIRLKLLSDAMPGVSTMLILDVSGTIVAASRADLLGKNFKDRAYFTVPRRSPNRAVLYVSPPFKTILDTDVIVLGRVLTNAKGEFAGVVTATLDPDYFNVVLQSVLYAADMHTTLIHGDGKVFLSDSSNGLAFGADLSTPGSLFERHQHSGQFSTLMVGKTLATAGDRMVAMRSLNRADLQMDRPLVTSVSRDLSAVYAPWRAKALQYGMLLAVLALGSGLGLHFSQRRRHTVDRLAAGAATERQQGAERLELALHGADLGLWDLHLTSQTVVMNARERDMLGFAPDETTPQGNAWRKLIHPDDWAVVRRSLEPVLKGQATTYECEHRMQHRDGHWVWIFNRAMVVERDAEGVPVRLVGTHLDITERKRADAELARSAQMLRLGEERMSVALEGSGLALFDWDIAGDRVYHSGQAAALRGEPAVEDTLSPAELRAFVHPDDLAATVARIKEVLTGAVPHYHAEFRIGTRSGNWLWIRARGRVVERDASGRAVRLAGTYADINERKMSEQRLRHLAEFDTLTDLPNRALFGDRLQQAMVRAARNKSMALLFLDIDHFKTVNDTLGHEAGDQLLKVFATRMRSSVRQSDTVARLAGDEFTIILEGLHGPDDAKARAGALVKTLREPVALAGKLFEITVSIGVAMFVTGETDDAALLRRADVALYEAKRRGRNQYACDEAAGLSVVVHARKAHPSAASH